MKAYTRQGQKYTKIVLWIFLLAVVCYFGYYVFSALYAPLTTAMAISYEAGSGCYTTGFVVREETVVRSRNNIATPAVGEGERVAYEQTVATGYLSDDAQTNQTDIERTEHQLEQLKYAHTYSTSVADQAKLDGEIQSRLTDLARSLARRDMNGVSDRTAPLKGLVMRRMSSGEEEDTMASQIAILEQKLNQLKAGTEANTTLVPAPAAGYFSGTVDGYERVLTVDQLDQLTVSRFQNLTPTEPGPEEIGKIITSDTWYYVTTVPENYVQNIHPGDMLPVNFSSEFYSGLTMEVVRVSEPDQGACVLILSCSKYLQQVTMLREQSADVIFSSYAGLRVPKEAIRVLEGQPGVFIVEGSAAAWKTVEILYDTGESYVVKLDKSSTDNLWPGDEIIVGARDLYDGKVVR